MQSTFSTSSRRGPDKVIQELAIVLSSKVSYEFKPLFDRVHANLRARNSATGGEEMLRLRTYEKLQVLVRLGMVRKTVTKAARTYQGLASLAAALPVLPVVAPAAL
jgi:hypothetical protein